MKINGDIKTTPIRKTESSSAANGDENAARTPISDKVNIGSRAEMQELKDVAMEAAPDEVNLQKLTDAIRSGEYEPDLGRLADRILSDPGTVDQLLAD